MSLRGPRGGRIRGRGSGRARGRGRGGKTIKWEWQNNYTPGPEVYDQLWHVRQEPATITPFLPTECPVPNAQSRITDRRQTEGDVQRNFYVVEVIHFTARESSVSSAEEAQASSTEIVHVDLSRILEYVSPDELERFENEQFRMEAAAEAIAKRIEAEEEAREQLERNARAAATGPGSRMISELNAGTASQSRGRPRGRGRGRGRGSWRGRGGLTAGNLPLVDDNTREDVVDANSEEALRRDEEVLELAILETEPESEDLNADELVQSSPTIARSAFVANSALPMSPVLSHRRASAMFSSQQQQTDDSSDDESDLELVDVDARSMSSAAIQLRNEDDVRTRSGEDSLSNASRMTRHMTQDSTSRKPSLAILQRNDRPASLTRSVPKTPSDTGLDDSDEDVPAQPPQRFHYTTQNSNADPMELDSNMGSSIADTIDSEHAGNEGNGEDVEEYVVETILEHYRDAGKKYYLVKWQGYEDSHDWLPEEDLEGAAELVADYNAQVRRKMGKQNMGN